MKSATKKSIIAIALLTFIVSGYPAMLNAQNAQPSQTKSYSSAIGLRFGSDLGISYRTGWGKGDFEGILSSGYRALMLTALYERNIPAFGRSDFHFFYGGGGHIGLYDRWYRVGYYDNHGYYHDGYYYAYYNEPTIGIDGIFGLEYQFPKIPFAASLDLKPFINIYRYDYGYVEGALTIRYTY